MGGCPQLIPMLDGMSADGAPCHLGVDPDPLELSVHWMTCNLPGVVLSKWDGPGPLKTCVKLMRCVGAIPPHTLLKRLGVS